MALPLGRENSLRAWSASIPETLSHQAAWRGRDGDRCHLLVSGSEQVTYG